MAEQRRDQRSAESAGKVDLYLLLALALSLLAALPILMGAGFINTRAGGDSPFLLQRVHQLTRNLQDGVFPARWMPDAAFGLGYPFFTFYAAFPYYVAALLNMSGLGILWGIKLTQTLAFLLAGGMMYALAQRLGAGPLGALMASAAYTFAPFHLVNVYVRGDALSEFTAMALYPLIGWALVRLRQRPSAESIAFLAAGYALLVLSHNISAMLYSPLIALWLLVEAVGQRGRVGRCFFLLGLAGIGLGLALSACFWAPALRERSLVQLGEQTTGYFHYAGHFRGRNLVQWRFVHSYDVRGGAAFSMGLAQALLGLLGIVALVVRAIKGRSLAAAYSVPILALGGYTWLIMPSSHWVWDHLPLLEYAQFPWRLLSVQAFAIALGTAWIPELLGNERVARWVCVALVALVTIAGMAGLRIDRLSLREKDISTERLMLYETYSGNIGSTIRHEYLPREMVPRPYASAAQFSAGEMPRPLALQGRLMRATLLEAHATEQVWRVTVIEPSLLAFHIAFYPGWEAIVDGESQGIEPLRGLGLCGLRLSPGEHRVRLYLSHTPVRRYSNYVSLLALGSWLALLLYGCLVERRYRRRALIAVAILVAWGFWILLSPEPWRAPSPTPDLLVMDWARAPYLHAEPGGLFFGAARLREYHLNDDRLRAGDPVGLRLNWDAPHLTLRTRLRLLSANAHLFEPAPIWHETMAPIAAAEQKVSFYLPPDIPPGLYVLHLEVLESGQSLPARTISGMALERLVLQPIQVVSHRLAEGDEPVLGHLGPENAPPVISLVGARAHLAGDTMEIGLTWRSERQAPLNYWLSLRLKGADGHQIVARDIPPFLGGYPTSLWQPGELLDDRVLLRLSDGQDVGEEDLVEIVLYDRLSLKAIGTVTLPLGKLW